MGQVNQARKNNENQRFNPRYTGRRVGVCPGPPGRGLVVRLDKITCVKEP